MNYDMYKYVTSKFIVIIIIIITIIVTAILNRTFYYSESEIFVTILRQYAE